MWNKLSISDKADYIKLAVKSGIKDLKTIRSIYNQYAQGGPISNPIDFPNIDQNYINSNIGGGLDQINNATKAQQSGYINSNKSDIENFTRLGAKGLSAIGTGLQWAKHPYAQIAGVIMGLPDLAFDLYDTYQNTSTGNITSTILDIPAKIPNIPGWADDAIRLAGISDDLFNFPSNSAQYIADYLKQDYTTLPFARLGTYNNPIQLKEATITPNKKF